MSSEHAVRLCKPTGYLIEAWMRSRTASKMWPWASTGPIRTQGWKSGSYSTENLWLRKSYLCSPRLSNGLERTPRGGTWSQRVSCHIAEQNSFSKSSTTSYVIIIKPSTLGNSCYWNVKTLSCRRIGRTRVKILAVTKFSTNLNGSKTWNSSKRLIWTKSMSSFSLKELTIINWRTSWCSSSANRTEQTCMSSTKISVASSTSKIDLYRLKVGNSSAK